MVRSKLDEHKLSDVPLRRRASRARRFDAGPFAIEMVKMAHSIPDSLAVAITCELGTTLDHRRLQVRPDAGGRHPRRRRRAWPSSAARGCCCSAATRPTSTGRAWRPRSRASGRSWSEVFARCEGRIVVTCFASNIHRVQQVVDAAAALGRKVALVGRSMRKNVNIGRHARPHRHPRGDARGAARDRGLPRPQARDDLDRQPGRAAVGAAADGPRRPPARGPARAATR